MQHKYGTMISHPHIKLKVPEPMSSAHIRAWLETVRATLPSGLQAQADIIKDGKPKSSSFYSKKEDDGVSYVVPLSRDPTVEEAQQVAMAWDRAQPEGDFEIDYSTSGHSAEIMSDIAENGLRELALEAAKLNHNDRLSQQSTLGWSYGIKHDSRNKKSPMMMPWEQLSPRYQLMELRRMENLLEILGRMDLRLTRARP